MYDDKFTITMLYDFFGDLLTAKQRDYFDLYHNEDLSLSEIAERTGISRQGVYDIITRAEKTLVEIESKTNIVARWRNARTELEQAKDLTRRLEQLSNSKTATLTQELTQILENFPL